MPVDEKFKAGDLVYWDDSPDNIPREKCSFSNKQVFKVEDFSWFPGAWEGKENADLFINYTAYGSKHSQIVRYKDGKGFCTSNIKKIFDIEMEDIL